MAKMSFTKNTEASPVLAPTTTERIRRCKPSGGAKRSMYELMVARFGVIWISLKKNTAFIKSYGVITTTDISAAVLVNLHKRPHTLLALNIA